MYDSNEQNFEITPELHGILLPGPYRRVAPRPHQEPNMAAPEHHAVGREALSALFGHSIFFSISLLGVGPLRIVLTHVAS